MSNPTPARPELPAPAWARDHHGETEVVTLAELNAYAAGIEAWARADARRKALEFAAASIDEIDDGQAPEYRACQEHIRSKIDRKEHTT